ncbi:hypothetical protein BSKO_05673 [Bryopsis sp. KO-2023]|nr:hypothetical protein BSKO_05673 [Bryopsis sp. KO-2023]
MARRSLLSAFLLFVVLSGTAQAKLSAKEEKMVKDLRGAARTTYLVKSFSVHKATTTSTDMYLSVLDLPLSSVTTEEQVTVRLRKPGSIDFYGKVSKVETDPFGGAPTKSGAEEVLVGYVWWARRQGETSWTEPDFDDKDNSDLLGYSSSFKEDATGMEVLDSLYASKIESIESIEAPTNRESCYKIVPTRKALLEDVGGDDFLERMIVHGKYSGNICVDKETGFLSTTALSMVTGGFTAKMEDFEVRLKRMDYKSKTTFSKFGEPVDLPDVSSPTAT